MTDAKPRPGTPLPDSFASRFKAMGDCEACRSFALSLREARADLPENLS
jgi:hypothetical protein